jgi:hypothetical protein
MKIIKLVKYCVKNAYKRMAFINSFLTQTSSDSIVTAVPGKMTNNVAAVKSTGYNFFPVLNLKQIGNNIYLCITFMQFLKNYEN